MKPDIIGRYTGRRLPHEGASFHTSMQARIAAKLYLGSLEDGPEAALTRSMTGIQQHGEHDFQIIDGSHGGEPFWSNDQLTVRLGRAAKSQVDSEWQRYRDSGAVDTASHD